MTCKQTLNSHNSIYDFRKSSDGCDVTWDIFDVETDEIITSIPFWSTVPDRMERSEDIARLFATSPLLLKSLRGLLDAVEDMLITHLNGPRSVALSDAYNALAQADGKEE